MSTLGRGQLLHLRLFIENVEVPVIGAMISASENSPAAAQIEIIPTDTAQRLLARSKVAMFYLDYEEYANGGAVADAAYTRELRLAGNNSKGIADRYYKLLFTGELFTLMYTKSGPGSRSLILQCLDDSNNWDTAFLYLLRYSDDGGESVIAGNQAAFLALNENANQFDDILNHPETVITQIAARQRAISPSLQSASGLIGGLFGVLELLGGVEGKYVGVTSWHTIQEARIRLMDQIAGDSGGTAQTLFDNTAFENWLTDRIGNAGSVISFRQLVELVNSYIYYSVFPCPVARFKLGQRFIPDYPAGIAAGAVNGLDEGFAEIVDQVISDLREYYGYNGVDKPLAVMTSGYRTLEQRNKIEAELGWPLSTKKPKKAHDWGFAADVSIAPSNNVAMGLLAGRKPAASVKEAKSLHHKCITVAELQGITTVEGLRGTGLFSDAEMDTIYEVGEFYRTLGRVAEGYGMNWGGSWEKKDKLWSMFGMGWDPVHFEKPGWTKEIDPDILASGGSTTAEMDDFYKGLPDRERMLTQFFRPDVWFCAPPSCNVIYPEELSSFTYTRQMMRETTRLQLTSFNAMYEDILLNQVYFAPSFEQVESLAAGGIGSAAKAIIYPHEKYTGIIPKMERISEVAFYSRMSEENRVESKEEFPEEEEGLATAESQMGMWAARTAAFNILTYRYSARSAVASGRFMPRLVPGWPAVVLDRPVDTSTTADQRAVNPAAPVHYLGIIKTLSHSVTQAGGTTSVTLSHARSHKIGDETDDLFASSIFGDKGVLSVQVDPGSTKESDIEIKEGMEPAEFKFCVALAQHLSAGGEMDPPPEAWESGAAALGPKGNPISYIEAEMDVTITAYGDTPDLTGSYLGTANDDSGAAFNFPFRKVKVRESQAGASGLLPLEEAIRPPWFSDEYSNAKIGELYQDLFGCGSILDLFPDADITASGERMPSVGMAVEKLVERYSQIISGGSAAGEHINATTAREYARLDQVIGTADKPGFFWDSCGNYSGLQGQFYSWMTAQTAVTQVNPTETQKISGSLDPRAGRYKAVVTYQAELLQFHGLRG
jgi:hypothetical protein